MSLTPLLLISAALALPSLTSAITLDTSNKDSICEAAAIIADDLMTYHNDNGTFDAPYYWWQYGTAYATLMNYQHICGDDTYEEEIYNGLLAQAGDNYDFQPSEYLSSIGNDDIGAYALAAMQAAEMGFKDPSEEGFPSWYDMAHNSYTALYDRWDDDSCNGGIRWQFNTELSGYDYKATIANGYLFQLAARLGRYTTGYEFIEAAESIYDWISGTGLTNELEYGTEVYDGFTCGTNCTDFTEVMWTYNYGALIAGSAYMYNVTGESQWLDRVDDIILGSQALYNNTILYERACESFDQCNTDQTSFKSIYARHMGFTAQLVPSVSNRVVELLEPAAKAAAKSCTGGFSGSACGMKWSTSTYDNNPGLGQQLNALEVVLSLLASSAAAPSTL